MGAVALNSPTMTVTDTTVPTPAMVVSGSSINAAMDVGLLGTAIPLNPLDTAVNSRQYPSGTAANSEVAVPIGSKGTSIGPSIGIVNGPLVQNTHPMLTRGKFEISKKKIFLTTTIPDDSVEPSSFSKASSSSIW